VFWREQFPASVPTHKMDGANRIDVDSDSDGEFEDNGGYTSRDAISNIIHKQIKRISCKLGWE
jgi:hypothetical protein